MDLYKKKSLKFSYKQVSRESRHAETLKARESSRFERLSMLRSLNEETINEKSVNYVKCEEKKKPLSRLDMLFKWKQEKEVKRGLEKKNKKPFYNLPVAAYPNGGFNASKVSKSRLVATTQPAKVMNISKQLTSVTPFQSSRIPNPSNLNGVKNTSGSTISSVTSKKNAKTFGYSVVSSANQVPVPKTAKSNKEPVAKSTDARYGFKTNGNSLKAKNQESSHLKPTFARQPSKPVSKIGIPTFSKGSAAQKPPNQKPATSGTKKPVTAPVSKLQEKTTPCSVENTTNRKKGYSVKTVSNKLAGGKGTSNLGLEKKMEEKNKSDNEKKSFKVESLSKQTLENVPDMIFDCDVSIIKRAPSFAPDNFKFIPPAGLFDIDFDSEIFERTKTKFISRTSTPTMPHKESSSPVAEAAGNDSPIMELLPTMLVSQSPAVSPKDNSGHSVCKEIQYEKETDRNINETTNNSAPREKVQKTSDVNPVSGITYKDNLPSEIRNELPKKSVDAWIDSPLENVDLNKIEEMFAKHLELKKLDDEELSNGQDNFLSERENEPSKISKDACIDSPFDIVDLNKIEVSAEHIESMKLEDEELNNGQNNLPNERENVFENILDVCVDSPLDIVDLNKMKDVFTEHLELIDMENEEFVNDGLFKEEDPNKCIERKPLSAPPKRTSILKNIPVLNSIAEIAETDDYSSQTPTKYSKNKQSSIITTRHSQRLSKLAPMEENCVSDTTLTPRRSVRLQNISARKFQFGDSEIFSPHDKSKMNLRRSMRLIDLNTPEDEKNYSYTGKTNITADFDKLTLTEPENINPHACLIDFDCSPVQVPKPRAKKISLLYSPEKIRRSMRKSIKGDLMSFSPSN